MGSVAALLLFSTIAQSNERPFAAPEAPELYPPAELGGARVDSAGVFLPTGLADWTGGFIKSMRLYPGACQRAMDRARDVEHEQCESRLADQAKAASVVMADNEGISTLGGVLIGAGGVFIGVAIGLILGLSAGK